MTLRSKQSKLKTEREQYNWQHIATISLTELMQAKSYPCPKKAQPHTRK